MIGQIFQRVNGAMMFFQVHTLIFTSAYVFAHCSFSVRNGEQHPGNGKHGTRRHQGKYLGFLPCDRH